MNNKVKRITVIFGFIMVVIILLSAIIPLSAALSGFNQTRVDKKVAEEIKTECPNLYTDYEFAVTSGIPQIASIFSGEQLKQQYYVDGKWTCQDYQAISPSLSLTPQ